MNTQSFTLDLKKSPVPVPVLYLGQGDVNGTNLEVTITDNGDAFDLSAYSVQLCIRQPLSAGYYEVEGTASGNVAAFTINETYGATTPGVTDTAYVNVMQGDTLIASTARFQCVILPNATYGIDPTKAYTNGVTEFLESAQEQLDDASSRAEAAIAAIGDISEIAVPLMSADVRGGAKLGSGLEIVDGALSVAEGRNLTPFFSYGLSGDYWSVIASEFLTELGNGWVHFERTKAAGSAAYLSFVPVGQSWVDPTEQYAMLIEWKNLNCDGALNLQANASNPYQLSMTAFALSGTGGATGESGSIFRPLTYRTTTNGAALMYSRLALPSATTTASGDLRLSIYKRSYTGEYVPYYPTMEEVRSLIAGSASANTASLNRLQPLDLADAEPMEAEGETI